MKLINFLDFEPLKEIMEKMKVDRNEKIEIERIKKIEIARIWKELSSLSGLDIDINETDPSEKGYIKYREFDKLVAYIRDQKYFGEKFSLRKFHIAYNCKTLSDSRKSRDASKYKIVQNKSPEFTINILSEDAKTVIEANVIKKLEVCTNCLKALNYKNFLNVSKSEQDKIKNEFSFEEFLGTEFDKNEELIKSYNLDDIENDKVRLYPKNWDEISYNYRKSKKWVCEECGKDCSKNNSELEVHHIDHNPSNSNFYNLKALCKTCHSKIHPHME
ncbi:HNH endonuclease [Fusobacterium hwasookii]|uniref:HNH nuclease n=1 Tax=Fusobacterium hwasookii ChDC F128 TaxID=1216362 RepID=A0ABP2R9W9_9FUSO|nr:HNH endonuclease [Fusobacterium hwasookii]EJU08779.1 HNH nuclease [Fusobacterium hwasookii ChDC F128]QNE66960.1 HNH endonuclease [Fusobacterium hwasookii]